MKNSLFGLTLTELSAITESLSLPSFTARQIADWLYRKKISSIDEMTNLSVRVRDLLSESWSLGLSEPLTTCISKDGTKKYLFPVKKGGEKIESAFIPEKERATLCVSSQIGCRMGCAFCMTARQGFRGNLTANEILNQFRTIPEHNLLTNIVFMGMGEPFDNLDEVMKSIEILTADYGYGWAPKRITVSTIGILPAVRYFLDHCRCHLAVSLHHPDENGRKQLMPIENKYPVLEIIEMLKAYDMNRQRRISFEYIMLAGINDMPHHARELAGLLNGLKCRINLIRYHSIPGNVFKSSDDRTIDEFAGILNKKGIITTVRQSRGIDIDAACGMLSTLCETSRRPKKSGEG